MAVIHLFSLSLSSFQAYMFKYDSTHGVFKGTINVVDDSTLEINGKLIKVFSKRYCHGNQMTMCALAWFNCK